MKNLILSNWNNILFLIFFILMSNSTCYRRNHDGILEGDNVFSLIEARVLGTKSTNGTASNSTVANLTLSSASNSTNSTSVTPNETISMSANVTTNATSSANNSTKDTNSSSNTTSMSQTPNTKTDLTAASNPSQELKDDLNKSKARLLDLEAAIREQAKAFDSLKDISGTVDNLAGKVDQTVNSNEKILVSVKDLKQLYNRIDFKLTTNSIENDNKLNVLNRHLTKNMKNQLNLQVIVLQRDITKTESDIKRLDVKINEIKIKLPNSNSVCSLYNSCGSCVTNSACGWCSLSHQCVDGDSKGPKDGSCSFYDYNICSGPRECSSYSDCDECIKDVACGWCSTSSSPMCMAKSEADKGKCSEDKFVHVWKSLNVCPFISMVSSDVDLIRITLRQS